MDVQERSGVRLVVAWELTVLMGASGVVGLRLLFSFLSVTGPDEEPDRTGPG